jgi:hypothetical protein
MRHGFPHALAARELQSSLKAEFAGLWLDEENKDETRKIEEQKKKQREREKALREQRKKLREPAQREQPERRRT